MSTINTYIAAPFGAGLTGLSSSVVATCTDAGGTTRSLGTLSFAEQLDAAGSPTTGIYTAIAPVDPTWAYPLMVQFGITGQVGAGAIQFVYAAQLSRQDTNGNLSVNIKDWNGTAVTGTDPVAMLTQALGLLGVNSVLCSPSYDSGNLLSATIRVYDTAAHATTNDGTTGLLHSYALANTYSGGNLSVQATTLTS